MNFMIDLCIRKPEPCYQQSRSPTLILSGNENGLFCLVMCRARSTLRLAAISIRAARGPKNVARKNYHNLKPFPRAMKSPAISGKKLKTAVEFLP